MEMIGLKTAIVYASKHGSVERCATLLSERIVSGADMINIYENNTFDIYMYDTIIIGASIYMGKIQHEIRHFCEDNMKILCTKELGLFICSALNHEHEFTHNFPDEIFKIAKVKENFGFELYMHNFSELEKIVLNFLPSDYLLNYGIKIGILEEFLKELKLDR